MTEQGLNSVQAIATHAAEKKIAHLSTSNKRFIDNSISLNGENVVNFGSCSYLGLEFEAELREGAKNAIDNFGTQFSSSRAYLSLGLYDELEAKLGQLFSSSVVVTPTTTLGHMAAIPVLVGKNDLVLLDHQVHNSVQTAAGLLKGNGITVELIRHNRMDLLRRKLEENRDSYDKIWYMADGIYSMYGDKTPIDDVYNLLNEFDQLRFYVDDAHAMSCFGENGRGFVLGDRDIHHQMVVATSLNKAFASGGGVLIFPNETMAQRVRNCGGPLITSGPMQPASLGAAIASVDLHLSGKINFFRKELEEKIHFTHELLEQYGLPNLAEKDSPIFFVAVSLPKVGYNVISKLKDAGAYVNLGIFPAVPMKNTGIRFTITRLHTFVQIEKMVQNLSKFFNQALNEEDVSVEQICKAFKIDAEPYKNSKALEPQSTEILSVDLVDTIIDVPQHDWNKNFGCIGAMDWNAMNVVEHSFTGNPSQFENYEFKYLTVKDKKGNLILQTVLSMGWIKDDMLLSADLSDHIEKLRLTDETLYTSKFLSVGTMVTEGDHLYLDKENCEWKTALKVLFEVIETLQREYEATTLLIRDLSSNDPEMDELMLDNGFIKTELPENYKLDISSWNMGSSFKDTLSKRSKRHFKENIEKTASQLCFRTILNVDDEVLDHYHQLYSNVQEKSNEINTFSLPMKFFRELNKNRKWEFIEISIRDEVAGNTSSKAVGVVLAYKGNVEYTPCFVGLDYSVNREFNVYRHLIFQIIQRAKILNFTDVSFGFSAGVEKKKFGATSEQSVAYVQMKDNFKIEALMTDSMIVPKQKVKALVKK